MTNVGGSLAVGATSYTDTTMMPGNTYTYEARSFDTAGNESAASPRVTVEVPGAPPPGGGSGGCQGQNCPPPIEGRLILPSCAQPRPAAGPDEAAGGLCLPGERAGVLADHTSAAPDWRIVFYHTDHLGTPRVLTDELGGVLSKHAFYPFGEEAPGPWPAAESTNTHWFTGHERDNSTRRDYMLARLYSSVCGRFASPDPLLLIPHFGGRSSLYTYVTDSPLALVDLTGRLPTAVHCLAAAGAGAGSILFGTFAVVNYLAPEPFLTKGGAILFTKLTVTLAVTSYSQGSRCIEHQEGDKNEQIEKGIIEQCKATKSKDDCTAAWHICVSHLIRGDDVPHGCEDVMKILRDIKRKELCPHDSGSSDPDCPPPPAGGSVMGLPLVSY
jgi:RHS repeat-associated protein